MLEATSEDHVQADPAQSLMREVGAQLRQRRLERGEDLDDVAQHLRIKPNYLFGIEQGDLSSLPGRPYALGFLRSYADYLGFDGDDLVNRIKGTVEGLTDRTRLRIRMPLPENRLPKTPVLVVSLAVVVGIYAGWSWINRSSRMVVDTVAEVPSALRDPTVQALPRDLDEEAPVADIATQQLAPDGTAAAGSSGSGEADLPEATAAAAAPSGPITPQAGSSRQETGELAVREDADTLAVQPAAGTDPAERTDAPGGGQRAAETEPGPSDGATADRSPEAARSAPENAEGRGRAMEVLALLDPAAGAPDGPQVYERSNTDARVILRAREQAWVQVSSLDGDYAFTRTLEPGEALLVPNRSDLELWTGNAGGLEIIVDGTPVPALAQGGAVRRHVSLDPERLLAAPDAQP